MASNLTGFLAAMAAQNPRVPTAPVDHMATSKGFMALQEQAQNQQRIDDARQAEANRNSNTLAQLAEISRSNRANEVRGTGFLELQQDQNLQSKTRNEAAAFQDLAEKLSIAKKSNDLARVDIIRATMEKMFPGAVTLIEKGGQAQPLVAAASRSPLLADGTIDATGSAKQLSDAELVAMSQPPEPPPPDYAAQLDSDYDAPNERPDTSKYEDGINELLFPGAGSKLGRAKRGVR